MFPSQTATSRPPLDPLGCPPREPPSHTFATSNSTSTSRSGANVNYAGLPPLWLPRGVEGLGRELGIGLEGDGEMSLPNTGGAMDPLDERPIHSVDGHDAGEGIGDHVLRVRVRPHHAAGCGNERHTSILGVHPRLG